MQFSQRDNRWKDIIMGDINPPNPSTNSIGQYGCLLCSLVSGLSDRGYGWDPASFNLLLRDKHAWVGPYKDYIDTANLANYLPDVFTSFQKIDPYNDQPKIDQLVGENLIVVCRVNARAIGGTGTHYLYLVGQQKGVALIYDPWRNVIELITKTYGNWGDVLGINIFTVRTKSTAPPTPVEVPPTPVVVPPVESTPTPPVALPVTPEPTIPPEVTIPTPPVTPTFPTVKLTLFQKMVLFIRKLLGL